MRKCKRGYLWSITFRVLMFMSYSLFIGIFANFMSFNTNTGLDIFSSILAIMTLIGLIAFYTIATIIISCKKSKHTDK